MLLAHWILRVDGQCFSQIKRVWKVSSTLTRLGLSIGGELGGHGAEPPRLNPRGKFGYPLSSFGHSRVISISTPPSNKATGTHQAVESPSALEHTHHSTQTASFSRSLVLFQFCLSIFILWEFHFFFLLPFAHLPCSLLKRKIREEMRKGKKFSLPASVLPPFI